MNAESNKNQKVRIVVIFFIIVNIYYRKVSVMSSSMSAPLQASMLASVIQIQMMGHDILHAILGLVAIEYCSYGVSR